MSRPDFITNEDIIRWSKEIDNDNLLPPNVSKDPIIRELCFAGLWLNEQLTILGCPSILITRIQYTAGKVSFGKENFWAVHQQFLDDYKDNKLDLVEDSTITN
jgi:hypothetical protein